MPRHESALSIVDQMMPAFHTVMWLAFATQDPDAATLTLQGGLDQTIKQLPFLSGTVFEKKEERNRTYVTWSDEAPKIPFEEMDGTSLPSYHDLCRHSMNLHTLKYDFSPPILKTSRTSQTVPAFIVVFIKLESGILVMFAPHHQMMDGGGRQVVFNMIAEHTRGLIPTYAIDAKEPLKRTMRLSKALQELTAMVQPDLGTVLEHDTNERLVVSQEFKSPTRRKIFELSVKRLDHLRTALNPYTRCQYTIGTLVTAILWVVISRVRLRRLRHANASFTADTIYTELVMAMNTRRYFEGTSLFEEGTWIGNLSTGIQPPPRLEFSTLALAEEDHLEVTLTLWNASNGDVGRQNKVSCPSAVLQAVEKITLGLDGPTAENTANFFHSAEKRSSTSQEFDFRQLRDMRALFNGLDLQ